MKTLPRRVVLESPYAGDVTANVEYARKALAHSLSLGEAPIASHLLYTQPGVLDDSKPVQRLIGMEAGHEWMAVADAVVVYCDLGISPGMKRGIYHAETLGLPVIYRNLGDVA